METRGGADLTLWMPKGVPGAAKLSVEHAAHIAILQLGGSGQWTREVRL